jgi:hypothetical protein
MRTLDEVIAGMDAIVAERREAGSCAGLFASMYRSVTREIRRSVRDGGFFDDDELAERTAVVFANRYIDAAHAYYRGEPTSRSWTVAFDCCESRIKRTILQHLLLGMNAHINFDLGIAVADTVEPARLPELYADFLRVNEILFTLVDGLQDGLGSVSPRMSWLDKIAGPFDEVFMRMSIGTARDLAWHFAEDLCDVPAEGRPPIEDERDRYTARLGKSISWRWSPVNLVAQLVAVTERRHITEAIDAFDTATVDLEAVAARVDLDRRPPDLDATTLLTTAGSRAPRFARRW